jgi:hypothetical protein
VMQRQRGTAALSPRLLGKMRRRERRRCKAVLDSNANCCIPIITQSLCLS